MNTAIRFAIVLLVCAGVSAGCSTRNGPAAESIALIGATVWDGTGAAARPNSSILIQSGRITWVGPSGKLELPRGARKVDVTRTYIIPGFVDTHYHLTISAMRYSRTAAGALDSVYDRALAARLLRVALARGITAVRDPGGSPRQAGIQLRDDVAAGRIIGPHVKVAGDILFSPRQTEDEIRAAVRAQAADGVDYIKVHAGYDSSQVTAAVAEAHKQGVKVIGHLQRTSWTRAARAGIDFIAHGANWHADYLPAERRAAYDTIGGMRARISWLEWLDVGGAAVDTMLEELVARKVSVDPTLVAYHTKFWWRDSIYQKHPDVSLVPEVHANWQTLGMHTAGWTNEQFDRVQTSWPNQLRLIKRMFDAGVHLTAGSDLASPWVIPGTAFHQELELLMSAGIGAADVLRIATRNGAEALGIEADAGTIEKGKRADLVVLRRNPLADIAATMSIAYVIKDGNVYTPEFLLTTK